MRYLKEYRKVTYTNFLTSGRLNTYLAEIDKQAQGITEQLKAKNALEWVGRLNNIWVYAMEIVEKEIIFHSQKVAGDITTLAAFLKNEDIIQEIDELFEYNM